MALRNALDGMNPGHRTAKTVCRCPVLISSSWRGVWPHVWPNGLAREGRTLARCPACGPAPWTRSPLARSVSYPPCTPLHFQAFKLVGVGAWQEAEHSQKEQVECAMQKCCLFQKHGVRIPFLVHRFLADQNRCVLLHIFSHHAYKTCFISCSSSILIVLHLRMSGASSGPGMAVTVTI